MSEQDFDDFQGPIDNARNNWELDAAYQKAWDWAQDRIDELEAPFILTDNVPTEPGWYFVKHPRGSVTPRYLDETNAKLREELGVERGWKWGSAPLPLPMVSDDE